LRNDLAVLPLVWPPERALGSFTSVTLDSDCRVTVEEQRRLDKWVQDAFAPHAQASSGASVTSANRQLISAHFPVTHRAVKPSPPLVQPSEATGIHPSPPPPWSGHLYQAPVTFDWTAMTAKVDVALPYLRVTRRGRWTFFKAEDRWDSTMTSGAFTISKHKEVKARYHNIGELDTRIGTAVLALANPAPQWTALVDCLPPVVQTVRQETNQRGNKPRHLHWLFAEYLRELIGATQFVGSPPAASSFGFTRIVHTQANPPLVFDMPIKAASVVWLNGVKPEHRGRTPAMLGNSRSVLMVVGARTRAKLQKARQMPRYWQKVASFPAQTRLMLSTKQFDFHPKASRQVLEVWANSPLRARRGVTCIGSFSMPEDPLQAINSMQAGRWTTFHEGAQDYPYRHVPGILAATDGAVKKYGKEGVLMSGGVAFREGDHNMMNTGVHVVGPISSFVAEGAAMLVLLETAPTDLPLTILTDSANVMWAMQHCSRLERVPDFSMHSNQDLLKRLHTAHTRRSAATHYVKITAHTSIALNECADGLAASARNDDNAPSRLFEMWENHNCIHYYREGENGHPARAEAAELRTHFIQLRSNEVFQNQTRTLQKLTAVGVGRHLMYLVLWSGGPYSVADGATKRMLQCITNTYPTKARLFKMGKARRPTCPFCSSGKPETLFHWQQECTRFHDARTKVHNDIWSAVYGAIRSHLPANKFVAYRETKIGDAPLDISNAHSAFKQRQPDGMFVLDYERHWTIVDFTRGNGNTRKDLERLENRKRQDYADLLAVIRERHAYVEFFPLVASYNGAIAEDTWRSFMGRLGLDDKAQTKVLYILAHALCIGFSTMTDIRLSCLDHNLRQ